MSVEQSLERELHSRADRVVPPEPDVLELLARGRAAAARDLRRRRTARWAGLAVAVALAVVTATLVRGDAQDPPTPVRPTGTTVRDLPTGAPPELPYCVRGGGIRVGGGMLRADCPQMVTRGGVTVAWDERGVHVVEADGARRIARSGPSHWVPAVSADGRLVAWAVADSDDYSSRIVVHALPSGRRVASARLSAARVWAVGFDGLGRVLFSGFGGISLRWLFDPHEGRLTAVSGMPPAGITVAYVAPRGFALLQRTWQGHGARSTSVEGEVDAAGRFRARRTVPLGPALWSTEWSRAVHQTRDGLQVSAADDLGGGVRLDLPDVGRPTVLPVWEDEDSLLVTFDPLRTGGAIDDDPDFGWGVPTSRSWLLRCSADTGDCEVALRPREAGRLDGPMYR